VPMRSDFPAPEAFLYDHIVTPFWNGRSDRSGRVACLDATAAYFHGPADADKTADIAVPITGDLKSPVKGSATLTDAQAADLLAGRYYLNIHTAAHRPGEVRGQVTGAK